MPMIVIVISNSVQLGKSFDIVVIQMTHFVVVLSYLEKQYISYDEEKDLLKAIFNHNYVGLVCNFYILDYSE